MEKLHTSRLFYGKYAYRILFVRHTLVGDKDYHLGWTVHNCKTWLNDNAGNYRMYNRVRYKGRKTDPKSLVTVTASLFLSNKEDFDSCIKNWSANIESVTEPYDESHVDLLKENTSIVIRDRLLYGRFRYVVTFLRRWGDTLDDIEEWVQTNLEKKYIENKNLIKWTRVGWNPRLYLIDEDDLVLTKLVWGERIRNIMVVHTRAEGEGV